MLKLIIRRGFMIPLYFCNIGEEFVITKIEYDIKTQHLKDMGFINQEIIKVINKTKAGMIVLVKGYRVAIGNDIAKFILGIIVLKKGEQIKDPIQKRKKINSD